jgi:hypothetical protein
MRPRVLLCAVLLFFVPLAAEAKGRAVGPGARDCGYGVIDEPGWANWIALDAANIYYYDEFDFTVYRVSKSGGARTPLAFLYGFTILDIDVDETNVYVAVIPEEFTRTPLPGSILAVPRTGGTYTTLASGVIFPYQLAVDGTHVYWVSYGTLDFESGTAQSDGRVERVRKDGSGRQTLAANLSLPPGLVLDADNVYFSELGLATGNPSAGVRRVAKNGGAVTHIDDQYIAADLALSDSFVVYFGGTNTRAGILRVPKSGGPSAWIVEDKNIYGGPKVFDGQIYYANAYDDFDGGLMRVPVSGGTPQFLGVVKMTNYDFAVDICGVYYGTYERTLMRSPR